MSDKLIHAQDVFLGKINQICSKFGLNNIMAQIYAIMYLSGKPMSLDDMVERLKISKGGASINIRALERYGAVRKVWVKGSRKDYYEAESDIAKVITDRIRSMAHSRLVEMDEMISSSLGALDKVGSADKADAETIKALKEKLEKLRLLHDKADSLFKLFEMSMVNGLFSEKEASAKEPAAVNI